MFAPHQASPLLPKRPTSLRVESPPEPRRLDPSQIVVSLRSWNVHRARCASSAVSQLSKRLELILILLSWAFSTLLVSYGFLLHPDFVAPGQGTWTELASPLQRSSISSDGFILSSSTDLLSLRAAFVRESCPEGLPWYRDVCVMGVYGLVYGLETNVMLKMCPLPLFLEFICIGRKFSTSILCFKLMRELNCKLIRLTMSSHRVIAAVLLWPVTKIHLIWFQITVKTGLVPNYRNG